MASKEVPAQEIETDYSKITRNDFPHDFVFGTATSAYQVEGGASKGGRGLSVWDAFTLRTPGKIADGSNGNEAVDMYTKYKEDIKMMKNMGFDAYRFSISWSRILPGGKLILGVNKEGVDYYNDLINTLLANGIQPFVTLFHWDLPFALEQEYGGFLSKDVVKDFRDYVELCFWEFGDRVKHWITLNEPTTYAIHGYVGCTFPPSKPDPNVSLNPPESDSSDEEKHKKKPEVMKKKAAIRSVRRGLKEFKSNYYNRDVDSAPHHGYNFVPYRGFTGVKKNFDLVKYGAVNEETINIMSASHDYYPETLSSMSMASDALYNLKPLTKSAMARVEPPKFVSDYITNMAKDSYTVGRNLLLAHAAAVESYRTKFKVRATLICGSSKRDNRNTLVTHWFEPHSAEEDDIKAAKRALDFTLGWYLEPILIGRYPQNMIDFVDEENLAPFSDKESDLLKGSIDFLGLNYYTAYYVANDPNPNIVVGYNKDQHIRVHTHGKKDGSRIGPKSGAEWLNIVPWGIRKLLKHVHNTYNNFTYKLPDIYITENGIADLKNDKITAIEACRDKTRVNYYRDHLGKILESIKEGVKVKGYFAWSWCDNFEWVEGYTYRFGLIYIDYVNHLKRSPKDSAMWFTKFLEKEKKIEEVAWFAKFLEEIKKKIDDAIEHAKLLEEKKRDEKGKEKKGDENGKEKKGDEKSKEKKGDEKEGEKKDEEKEYPFFENPFM